MLFWCVHISPQTLNNASLNISLNIVYHIAEFQWEIQSFIWPISYLMQDMLSRKTCFLWYNFCNVSAIKSQWNDKKLNISYIFSYSVKQMLHLQRVVAPILDLILVNNCKLIKTALVTRLCILMTFIRPSRNLSYIVGNSTWSTTFPLTFSHNPSSS